MPENTSSDEVTSAATISQEAHALMGSASHCHRGWPRVAGLLATVLIGAFLLADVRPAAAASSLRLVTSASMGSTVGSEIFANVNLMNTTEAPTGTVTFRMFAPADTTCVGSPMFTSTVAVTGTSINSARYLATQAGVYRWTTSYSGDANYFPAGQTSCSYEAADVTVSKARNVIRLAALEPVDGVLVATGRLSGYDPRGTMTFVLFAPGDRYCSSPLLTANVTVDGIGTYNSPGFAPSASGTYQWRASYGGDAENRGASMSGCWNPSAATEYTA